MKRISQEEAEAQQVAGEWWDMLSPTKRREAFIGMVVCNETEVIGHIKTCIKKSLGLIKEDDILEDTEI